MGEGVDATILFLIEAQGNLIELPHSQFKLLPGGIPAEIQRNDAKEVIEAIEALVEDQDIQALLEDLRNILGVTA